ncbi:B-cell antigen receptor complex-associated protein alpha chain [Myiozetetes cayanensis]|uniref:B-cell antigen receptor complex-associated protein alpha chain n=1 Tax=Myiozetetes cayanensis TaxID=478635 RepID=UPI00215FD338|nr:B-cell antigen receptor complex-associated protein alpha chain [Myiozetetes cayanensis]
MEGALQNRGAPPNWGVTRPLLILVLLLAVLPEPPRRLCPVCNPPAPGSPEPPTPLTVTTRSPPCSPLQPRGGLWVWAGPPSRTGAVGDPLTLECHFRAPPGATLNWLQVCPPRYGDVPGGCSGAREVVATRGGQQVAKEEEGRATLTFPKLSHNDSGLFFCRVEFGAETARSCGTFVRVREPVPVPFLDLRESTKNRILTAQGVLLLLCSAGPGLLLLLRKRWANEQLLRPQKPTCEEENLYEGLNLDECSMYEDISRGVQPTYQDVGTLPSDSQLEKP